MQLVALAVVISLASVINDDAPAPANFTKAGHTIDSLAVVKKLVKAKKAVLIDVRETDEWDNGHLQDAICIPLSVVREDELTPAMKKNLPRDKPIYCHCMSGQRVLIASKLLRCQGYDIRPLELGYAKLLDEGFTKATKKDE